MRRKKNEGIAVQTAVSEKNRHHPFEALDSYMPSEVCERRLYRTLREAVPMIDAAIYKIIRLIGEFRIKSDNKSIEKTLSDFLNQIRVNSCGIGIESFLASFLDQLLTYGTAVGEMIPNTIGEGIQALYNPSLEQVEICADKNPFDVHYFAVSSLGERVPVKYPDLLFACALYPEQGSVYGRSILKGLPFVTNILLKIYNTIGINWERVGNVRFAVSYNPPGGEKMFLKERAEQMASEWSKTMHSNEVRDFVSVGDVQIRVIGADNQILDSEVPVRQILEQIVAKLSIPPFLLGLSWSSTERMSVQQADILTSELEYYRRLLNPVIEKICRTHLNMIGQWGDFSIEWEDINLQDTVELSQARLNNAKAEQIELENRQRKGEI